MDFHYVCHTGICAYHMFQIGGREKILSKCSNVRVSRSMPVFFYRGHYYLNIATTYLDQIEYRDFIKAWVHLHLLANYVKMSALVKNT